MGVRNPYGQLILCSFLLCSFLPGCSEKPSEQGSPGQSRGPEGAAGELTIFAVNYPLSYFAERLAPASTEVRFPVPEGLDPAFWRPSVEQIVDCQNSDLILLNGAGYASWTRYATLPRSRSVVTSGGCRETFIEAEEVAQHRHGPGGEHAHGALAFTTWLDLGLALCQAERVRDAIVSRRPESTAVVSEAFDALRIELTALDDRLRRATSRWGDTALLASHPVYQYLAEAYDLRIDSLHLEPDEPLTVAQLRHLEDWAQAQPAGPKLMLWEAEPLVATRRQLREHGIEVVVFEPMGAKPAEGDFLSGMSANVERLSCAMGAGTCP